MMQYWDFGHLYDNYTNSLSNISSYFALPKSQRAPEKWWEFLNVKEFNKYDSDPQKWIKK